MLMVTFCTAGVENICEITAPEMDAATLKLLALVEIVGRLTRRLFGGVRGSRTRRVTEKASARGAIAGQSRPHGIMIATDGAV